MYQNVLVPFDFSDDSRNAVSCLSTVPGIRKIVLLHVVYTRYPSDTNGFVNPEADYARLRLEEYARGVSAGGAAIVTRVAEVTGGNISDVINAVGREEKTDLVVIGRRGRGIIETVLLGSVASEVLRYGETDLLLIGTPAPAGTGEKPPCLALFSHVLVCTDFSEPDIATLCREKLPSITRVSLIHVVTHGDSEKEVRESSDSAWVALEKLKGDFSTRHIPAEIAVRVGSAPEEILKYAGEKNVSLIAMKSAGKRGFVPSFLGTTTAQVARNARVPVIIFRKAT